MCFLYRPWNPDDFNGFGAERAAILDMAKEYANNPIILGGDLHDSFAWTLYDKGNMTGDPVAVNLGVTGVTSPGWGPGLYPFLKDLEPILGGTDTVYELMNQMYEGENPGKVHANVQYKGFYAVKATTVRTIRDGLAPSCLSRLNQPNKLLVRFIH